MSRIELQKIDLKAARSLLDFGTRMDSPARAEEQLCGAVALHNLLAEHRCAYLADEVGMGKTYVALGAMALMQHFHPALRVLIIAPRENIQNKWEKELRNLVQHNVRFSDLRLKTLNHSPAMPLVKCTGLLDLVQQTNLHPHGVFFTRMTSFSLGLAAMDGGAAAPGRRDAARLRDELRKHLPWLDTEALDLRVRDREAFKDAFARCLCCALPAFDLVIVDEAHNLKHGFKPHAAARNRVMALALGHTAEKVSKSVYPGYGSKAARVLFLSATPIEESYTQLWNQLDIFGLGDVFPELRDKELDDVQKKAAARRFLLRRVTAMKLSGQELTKNLYRREWRRGGVQQHDDPIRVTEAKQRLVLALVQKKVAESIGHEKFGASFQMGMLASFESFQETAATRGKGTPSGEEGGNFDGGEQTDDRLEREGIDVRGVNRLARSYRSRFHAELPHPKMDALVSSLAAAWETGEKSLIFVRRVASVTDLKRKLDDQYDQWLFRRLRQSLPAIVLPKLESQIKRYTDERLAFRNEQQHELSTAQTHDDAGGKDTFFAWFFRGEGPGGVLSGAALLKRFRQSSAVLSTFFEDNHVADVLGCEATQTLHALSLAVGLDEETLCRQLGERARMHLTTRAQKLARADVFAALQAAALSWLAQTPGPWQESARVIGHERFGRLPARENSPARLLSATDIRHLNLPTLFTELRRPEWSALRARLWPISCAPTTAERFREEALRAALLGSAARLGHGLIDLYCLTIQQLQSMDLGSRDDDQNAQEHLHRYLGLLEEQRVTPLHERSWSAFDELADIAAHFDLILDVNLPQARDMEIAEARHELGSVLGSQQPVGGMWGSVNGRLVKQFRMPGYPLVMISTDLLQEGEDLHTFCSRIHHYGISWTPSSMEQRTGRIDRVRSLTERRLLHLNAAPEQAKLQVHFPHLEDTVEVLQVRRLLTRMNTFLQLMHEGLQLPEDDERTLNVSREILRHHQAVHAITTRLETAFPVNPADLRGDVKHLARSAQDAETLVRRFVKLRGLATDLRFEVEPAEHGPAGRSRIFGTVRLTRRVQPFALYLHSFENHLLVRCLSPVGRVQDEHQLDTALAHHRLSAMRLGALEHDAENPSYDLTAEDDVLLSTPEHDLARVTALVIRVTAQADDVERLLLGADEPLQTFQEDLKRE